MEESKENSVFKENQKILEEINDLGPWFHNLHLPTGEQTAPDHFLGDFPSFKWEQISPGIPEDLTGWKVLDIGCNAGFYSIELAKRGAEVLAIDLDPHYLKQANWAARQFGLDNKISFRKMQVYDLARFDEKFDLVWFMGVFYHLRYPLLALDILSGVTDRMMVFQTLSMPGKGEAEVKQDYQLHDRQWMLQEDWPKMAFIENKLNGDPTNWWAANHAAIMAMMRSCGMKVIDQPGEETYICVPDESLTAVARDWNSSEYLSATGQEWQLKLAEKVKGKNS